MQNLAAAAAFLTLLSAEAAMLVLDRFPSSELLWQVNLIFARELRPVLEVFDAVLGANPAANMVALTALLALCLVAVRRRHLMLTAATTHTALFGAIYASIASFGANLGPQVSSLSGIIRTTWQLNPLDQALAAAVLTLFVMCVLNHFDILRDLVTSLRQPTSSAS